MSDIRRVLDLYDDGLSLSKISKETGLSPYKVRKIITDTGRQIRQGNYQGLSLDTDEINMLYDSGMSTYAIAEKFKCSDETIRRNIRSIKSESDRNKRSNESKRKISKSCKAKWQEEDYREKVQLATSTAEYKMALSEAAKRDRTLAKWSQSDIGKKEISTRVEQLWKTPEYFAKQSVYFAERGDRLQRAFKKRLEDPAFRQAWIAKCRANTIARRMQQPRISSTQAQLYYILENSDIAYYEEGDETQVGPFYVVDCIVPKQQSMVRDLIIEVQGEYWHSLKPVKVRDAQKQTYVRRHTNYDLLYLEELDMKCWDEVCAKLNQRGLKLQTIECRPKQLSIRAIGEVQASLFYSVFHYSHSIRKGATTFGVYYGDLLVAAISYTYPIRREVSTCLGAKPGEVIEISRLARATNLKCKNLMSWLIRRTRKLLPRSIRMLVAFSDSTQGHTGITYKACGFNLDSIIGKDYHYESVAGKYHKKTIWDKAKQFKMTEAEYAATHGLTRVEDGEKTKWVFEQ